MTIYTIQKTPTGDACRAYEGVSEKPNGAHPDEVVVTEAEYVAAAAAAYAVHEATRLKMLAENTR